MAGVVDIQELLRSLSPEIQNGEYAFCTVVGNYSEYAYLEPLCSFRESEGLALIVPVGAARESGLKFESIFKQITLTVHSSLEAVGLTAAVAAKLASCGISANVVAAYYHDHIFVQTAKANEALQALKELAGAGD